MHSDYDHLISKLDGFIRKYYADQAIRGALYSVGLLVGVFLSVALLESQGHFGIGVRDDRVAGAHLRRLWLPRCLLRHGPAEPPQIRAARRT